MFSQNEVNVKLSTCRFCCEHGDLLYLPSSTAFERRVKTHVTIMTCVKNWHLYTC